MKLTSPESIQILEYALEREIETQKFYLDNLARSTNPGTQDVLKSLAADEERHAQIVSQLIESAKSDGSIPDIARPGKESLKDMLKRIFPHVTLQDSTFTAESASVQETLKKALENETDSFNTYSKAAEDSEETELKDLYTYLAEEENKHYNAIDNLLNYLDDPGKWLYEEENLIFRRG